MHAGIPFVFHASDHIIRSFLVLVRRALLVLHDPSLR